MSISSTDVDQQASDPIDAYRRGVADGKEAQVEECASVHLDRIADVLDAIDQHAGDTEALRANILAAMGHGGAR